MAHPVSYSLFLSSLTAPLWKLSASAQSLSQTLTSSVFCLDNIGFSHQALPSDDGTLLEPLFSWLPAIGSPDPSLLSSWAEVRESHVTQPQVQRCWHEVSRAIAGCLVAQPKPAHIRRGIQPLTTWFWSTYDLHTQHWEYLEQSVAITYVESKTLLNQWASNLLVVKHFGKQLYEPNQFSQICEQFCCWLKT